jgi:glycolate oxidase FAD binding subunit
VKFSVLPTRIAATCDCFRHAVEKAGLSWKVVVQATGLGWARLEAAKPEALRKVILSARAEVEREAGSLAVLHRPAGLETLEVWGSPGDAFPLMVRVKQQLDPQGTLNPGRFAGGI